MEENKNPTNSESQTQAANTSTQRVTPPSADKSPVLYVKIAVRIILASLIFLICTWFIYMIISTRLRAGFGDFNIQNLLEILFFVASIVGFGIIYFVFKKRKNTLLLLAYLFFLIISYVGVNIWAESQSLSFKITRELDRVSYVTTDDTLTSPPDTWKTYSNPYGFSFQYPEYLSVEESIDGSNSYNIQFKGSRPFIVTSGPAGSEGFLERNRTGYTTNADGVTNWYIIKSSRYCDAGMCTDTLPGYYIVKDKYYVALLASESAILNQILENFKFAD